MNKKYMRSDFLSNIIFSQEYNGTQRIRTPSIRSGLGNLCCRFVHTDYQTNLAVQPSLPAPAFKTGNQAQPAFFAVSSSQTIGKADAGNETICPVSIPAEEDTPHDSLPEAIAHMSESLETQTLLTANTQDTSPQRGGKSLVSDGLNPAADTAACATAFETYPEYKPCERTQATPPSHEDCLHGRGLLHFGQWWEFRDVVISVNGSLISGVPAFFENGTLRIINDDYSYFIPLEKVDYIRTDDGLDSALKRQ